MLMSKPHSKLFETVGVALDEYEYLWKLHASGIDIYERTHRLAVDALADIEEQLQAAEDHIEGLCKELDSRAPGWENETPWYAREKSLDDIDPRDLGDGMEATIEPGDEMTEADLDALDPAKKPDPQFEYDQRMAGVPDE